MDPMSGDILAMASYPTYDPNDFVGGISQAKLDALNDKAAFQPILNRAIQGQYAPGSTFKIVVASAALTESVISPKTLIYCENGAFSYGGRVLRDHHGYGQMTVHDILMKSSNIGSAKMALMMGDDKFYEYVRRFGFGERTGVALPGEIPGLVHPPSRWDRLTITRMPMGQSVAVTPLQIVMGMSVIANGGKLMRPQIIKSIKDSDGQEILSMKPEIVREVIPPETARFVSDALTEVRGSHRVTDQNPEEKYQALERYGRDLTELRRFLVSQDVSDLRAVGSHHLIGFLTALRERELSARSQARILTTLRRFYRFLEREETLPNGSPTAHLLLPKIGRSLPHARSV
jgi:cell division protein FtsI/penicillin-binding protein 2